MDLVDEEDVIGFEIGQQCGEIARLGDHRAGCGAKSDAQFLCDDLRQRGLAESRRPEEQHMVHRLPPRLRCLDEHAQILARSFLPDEFGERFGAQGRVRVFRLAGGGQIGISRHEPCSGGPGARNEECAGSALRPPMHDNICDGFHSGRIVIRLSHRRGPRQCRDVLPSVRTPPATPRDIWTSALFRMLRS